MFKDLVDKVKKAVGQIEKDVRKVVNNKKGGKIVESYFCPTMFFQYILDEGMRPGEQSLCVDLSQYEEDGIAAYVVRGSPECFLQAQKWLVEIGEDTCADDTEIVLMMENTWLDKIQYWGYYTWSWRFCLDDSTRECEEEN